MDTLCKKITIKMSVDDVSEESILNLESILRNVNGTQSLNFTIWDAKEKIELSLPSRNTKIKISSELLATLDKQQINYKLN
jgi:DNA polymerase-3 subunit alpha